MTTPEQTKKAHDLVALWLVHLWVRRPGWITRMPDQEDIDWLADRIASELESTKTENERLRALLADKDYLRCKADYNRGHLSYAGYLERKEEGLGLSYDEAQSHGK